jgi:hypothetical protein
MTANKCRQQEHAWSESAKPKANTPTTLEL